MAIPFDVFFNLGVALAIGLLIGVERGWEWREAEEGARIAGVRTFGLLGLLGGVSELVAAELGMLFLGLAFLSVAGVLAVVYTVNLRRSRDVGITSLVAALLTFILGAMAAMGEVTVAAALSVVTVLLLGTKPVLHDWLRRLEERELRAAIKLLLISVVLLPVLPDQGYGPWQALNPYRIWWMVVLIAMISFAGYFAIKIAGTTRGILYTSIFAGLASSTALTLHFSRTAHKKPAMTPMLATGILLASGTMLPRMCLVSALINPRLLELLAVPAAIMAAIIYSVALLYWRASRARRQGATEAPLENPLELKTAVGFGVMLAVIMLLGVALKEWLGETGIFMLAAASGLADVDAITLSLANLSHGDVLPLTAVSGILIAASVNSLVKGGMAAAIGGRALGARVGIPLLVASVAGLSTLVIMQY